MRTIRFSLSMLLAAGLFLCSSGCDDPEPSVIRIYGSTTTEPVLRAIADAFSQHERARIEVVSTGSHEGVNALVGGRCEIAASSVPVTEEELGEHPSQYREFVFGYDMVVPIVHPRNPLDDLSPASLQEIYSGRINRWSQLGGEDLAITVVNRDRDSGTHDIWNRIIAPIPEERLSEVVLASNSAVLAYVAAHPAAIGYISSGFVNQEVKPLSVNGIEASVENARTKRYPLFRRLLLYTSEACLNWDVKSFIIYLLSDEGQKHVKAAGFVPVNIFGWEEGSQ